jgi:hypothetical protein
MQVVTPFISLFALLMHTQQHAWSIRISMHGMLDIYFFCDGEEILMKKSIMVLVSAIRD